MAQPLEYVEHVQDILKVIPGEIFDEYECYVTVLVREAGKDQQPWNLVVIYQGYPPTIKKYAVPRGAPEWQRVIADDLTKAMAQPPSILITGFPSSVQEGAASALAMMKARRV